jgi:hypothetical protein
MAVDTPARIVILGAGPIGLEAALYGRFLGYQIDVYERGRVAEQVIAWENEPMRSRFGENRSPLALAALAAQDPGYRPPSDEEILTGKQWRERYLLPLSETDLLEDSLHTSTHVLAVGNHVPAETDADSEINQLRITLEQAGQRQGTLANVVIDATGADVPSDRIVYESADDSTGLARYVHVLGAKGWKGEGEFRFGDGLRQIRETFAILGDRADLNLYESIQGLLP